jgi:LysR family transcriptional regulator, nitrogen assimilation regulatory protein
MSKKSLVDALAVADLARLKRFLVVSEIGSLTKAALSLGTTQSVLSLQMAALERDCGDRLFDRTGRGVALTELGCRLALKARDLLRDAQLLTQDIQSAAGVPYGDVVVGLLPSISHSILPLLCSEVIAKYPNIRLRLLEGSNGQLDEWLSSGRLDFALLYRYRKTLSSHEESLRAIDSWLVGAKGDVLTKTPTIAFNRLHQLPLVLPSQPNGLRSALDQHAQRKSIELKVVIEVDSIPSQKCLAAKGLGYAVLGRHAVLEEIASGSLQAAKITNPSIPRAVTLATASRRPTTLATRTVTVIVKKLVYQAFEW